MTGAEELSALRTVTPDTATTDVDRARAGGATLLAEAAARSAGVGVRTLTDLGEIAAAGRLFAGIWGRDTSPPVGVELLRALAKAGNYVCGAFDGAQLVGACVGFFSAPAGSAMHSHIAGVSAAARGRDVGFAMKLHQRAWALGRGLSVIAWTFDPLVSRNAYFNIAKLVAEPVEYLPNFYGGMRDGINGGDDSDRLLVHWALARPDVESACARRGSAATAAIERARGAAVALGTSVRGAPVPGPLDAATSLVAVPRDIEVVRAADPGLAAEWRVAVREALQTLLSGGARITGFDRAGWYVVRHGPPPPTKGPAR